MKLLKQLSNWWDNLSLRQGFLGLGLMCLLTTGMHFFMMKKPPMGHHVWRQTFTASVAVNFYEEDMNIFKPRVNHRKDQSGVTGMQFPLYEWVCAALFKVFGFNESIFRWVSFSFFLVAVFFCFRWLVLAFGKVWLGLMGAWMMIFSPELYYHGVNALPDISALCFAMMSMYSFWRYTQTSSTSHMLLSYLTLALAGLIKIHFLMFGAMWLMPFIPLWQQSEQRKKLLIQHGIAGILSVGLVLSWYYYASILRLKSDLKDVGLYTNPIQDISTGLKQIVSVVVSDFPDLLLGYAPMMVVVAGFTVLLKGGDLRRIWRSGAILVIGVMVIYFFLELNQFGDHGYYLIPFIAIVIFFGLMGLKKVNAKWVGALSLLLLVQPALTAMRINHRWTKPNEDLQPLEFLDDFKRKQIQESIPDGTLTVVGPDLSGCIYFYFTDTEGYNFTTPAELTPEFIQKATQAGATHLVSSLDLPLPLVTRVDEMKVYELK